VERPWRPLVDVFTFAGDVDAALRGVDRVRRHLGTSRRSSDWFALELIASRTRTPPTSPRQRSAGERWEALSVLTIKLWLDTATARLDHLAARRARARRALD
jgi:hypothetical protein